MDKGTTRKKLANETFLDCPQLFDREKVLKYSSLKSNSDFK